MKLRKLLAVASAVALAAMTPALAQNLPETVRIGGQYTSLGYCQMTTLTSASLLSNTSVCSTGIPTGAVLAEMCSESVALRYRDDGTSPTAGVGMPIATNTCFQYSGPLAAFSVIQAASSGILDVTFYK